MSFDTDEMSVQDSQPIELFTVTAATGVIARYTSYAQDVLYLGNMFFAKQIRRSAIQVVTTENPGCTVEIFVGDPVVQAYIGQGVPPQSMTIAITRLQKLSGTAEQQWSGYVNNVSVRGRTAAFMLSAITDSNFAKQIPKVVISRQCNHTLYDQFCTITRNFRNATIVSMTGRTMVLSTGFGLADQHFRYGDVQHLSSHERRSVTNHVNSGVGQCTVTVDVNWPTTVGVGDSVQIFAGCDHTVQTCRDKFSNVVNFGGHPQIQSSNFFFLDIRRAAGN